MSSVTSPVQSGETCAQGSLNPISARSRGPGNLRRGPAQRRPIRLTRRGRMVSVIALALLAFALVSLGRVVTVASTDASGPPRETIVVQPGQTLWQIAAEIEPGVDPRITVDRLIEINGLGGAEVSVGQQLLVPVSDP
jgi:LysM repeat protein